MSGDRDIRDVVVGGIEMRLRRPDAAHMDPHVLALEIAVIVEAHGVRFSVPPHRHDPNANWKDLPEPGDTAAGVIAGLAAIGKGLCTECGGRLPLDGRDRIQFHDISDDPPHPPFRPCPGGGKPPRMRPDIDEDQEHQHE